MRGHVLEILLQLQTPDVAGIWNLEDDLVNLRLVKRYRIPAISLRKPIEMKLSLHLVINWSCHK